MDSKHSIYNKNLKKLAVLADIHLPLSSHYARHTSAHIKLINGEDIYDIKQSLGQTDLATTERYVERFDQPRLEQVNKRTDNFIPLYYSC